MPHCLDLKSTMQGACLEEGLQSEVSSILEHQVSQEAMLQVTLCRIDRPSLVQAAV